MAEASGDDVLRHVVRHATAGLRLADILFRYGSDEFVVLLNDTNAESAKVVGERIRDGIRTHRLPLHTDGLVEVDVSVIAVSSPGDGASLPALIETARARTRDSGVAQERSTIP